MKVKLKNGRVGFILANDGEYRTVVIPAQGNECSRTGAKATVQNVHHSKVSELK
jgi:hypothetical protein